MKVLFAASEVFPLVKTGGLADVAGALPAALGHAGVDVRLLMPGYPEAMDKVEGKRPVGSLGDPLGVGEEARLVSARIPGSGVPVWLIDCPALYGRAGNPYLDATGHDWPDNAQRFGLLSWAAAHLATDGSPVKWRPQLIHGNDWQTGLTPALLRGWNVAAPPTVFTIHNIAYQGLFPKDLVPKLGLAWDDFVMDGFEYWDQLSFLKAGLAFSDALTTVSPRYAKEIQTPSFGCGMEGLLAHRADVLSGILNGVDYAVWSPVADPHIPHPYDPAKGLEGKALNKRALQAKLGLKQDARAPLMVVVSRLADQKGMDLVLGALPAILKAGAQLAVVGTGDRTLEDGFKAASANNPSQVAVHIGYSEELAHVLMAAGDMLLLPSRFEPCGLTQFYAFRYGTVPVAHATGGLADTVVDTSYDGLMTGTANGFVFEHANVGAFQWAIERALAMFATKEQWRKVQMAGIYQDFSWDKSAARYVELYRSLIAPADKAKPASKRRAAS
jgi:starch synthase